MKKIKVVNYGIGVIGKKIIEQLMTKDWIEIVGAVDISKDIIGKDLGQVLNIDKNFGVAITSDVDMILSFNFPHEMKQVYFSLPYEIRNLVVEKGDCHVRNRLKIF